VPLITVIRYVFILILCLFKIPKMTLFRSLNKWQQLMVNNPSLHYSQ
jgi:hypothetical protein